ncbi:hypothetical protein ACFYOT_21980 [Saccharothrix saharensis]|uniref:hypothetical protein n=1 Tax=Saccharothrix saharensis TaxID=571190 RepID=UPI003686806F
MRAFDPARPVWVDLGQAHREQPRSEKTVPPVARNRGVTLEGTVPGELHAWVRSTRGGWLALVSFSVPWFGFSPIPVRQLVPGVAVAKRRSGETEPPF